MSLPSLTHAKRIVIKLGSSLVADAASGHAKEAWLSGLAAELAPLHAAGQEIVLVSSGAVALGRPKVGLGVQALSLGEKQAAAAAGQPLLMQAWQAALAPHGIHAAQLLLTLDDSEQRERYLNARATFHSLLSHRLMPIVNENDSVATAELKFGDNDRLAARVAGMIGADVLVLFSDIDGLYTADPRKDPTAQHLPRVDALTPEILAMGGGSATGTSSGGMRTKLDAAAMALAAGCHMVITRGEGEAPLTRLAKGGLATWFVASTKPQLARKHWIATSVGGKGAVTVDAGAARALAQGKSLLPAGVKAVEGEFAQGDTIAIKDHENRLLARGIVGYSSAETQQILGKKSSEIAAILGYAGEETLIHRDDLAMLQGGAA